MTERSRCSERKPLSILGAGASCHYGYPTGEALVRRIHEKATTFHDHCSRMMRSAYPHAPKQLPRLLHIEPFDTNSDPPKIEEAWRVATSKSEELITRLSAVDPLVIDYFLGHKRDLKDLGKFLIAWVLLECEAQYASLRNSNHPKQPAQAAASQLTNWLKFLIHKLVVGCSGAEDLIKVNDISFITFNYDVSLEYYLHRGLSANSFLQENACVDKIF